MRILVTNDDGIDAIGLHKVVNHLAKNNEVLVVAPLEQCSAKSMSISLRKPMELKKVLFDDLDVEAYSLTGTPVDCVKVGLNHILSGKPDLIISGLNNGYNTGFDTMYSATVGAAMEGLMNNIPSIALSNEANSVFDVFERYFDEILDFTLKTKLVDKIYNINFPGCKLENYKGIWQDAKISKDQIYCDKYFINSKTEQSSVIQENGLLNDETKFKEGTDVYAVYNGYISISTIKCNVM